MVVRIRRGMVAHFAAVVKATLTPADETAAKPKKLHRLPAFAGNKSAPRTTIGTAPLHIHPDGAMPIAWEDQNMLKEFKAFAMRGSFVDMAVGIVIGAAFGKIVSSFVTDIFMPPLGLILGRMDFSNYFLNFSGKPYASLSAAKAAGAATLNYGMFINNIIDFLIVAFAMFLVVRQINRMMPAPPATPSTKACPYCVSVIPVNAIRCPNCTSELKQAA